MKIKIKTLWTGIITFLVFHMAIISINSLYWKNYEYGIKRYLDIIVLLLLILLDLRLLIKKRYIVINTLVALLAGVAVYSSWINQNLPSSSVATSVFYAIQIIDCFLYGEYIESSDNYDNGIKTLFYLSLFYCLLTDVFMFLDLRTKTYAWGTEIFYLIGNKFNVAYLHLLVIVLFAQLHEQRIERKKTALIGLYIWSFVVSVYVQCTTAIIGLIIIIVFFAKKDKYRHFLVDPKKIFATLLLCDTVLVFFSQILKFGPIRFVIENILHESVDLTNRVYIYERSFVMLFSKPWFGYGYDNNIAQSRIFTHANNTQNGLMDCIVSYGIIGTILTVAIILVVVAKCRKRNSYALLVLMLTYVVMSSVEITIRGFFFLILALAMCSKNIDESVEGIGSEISINNYTSS